jgi:hypothetical protein
MSNIYKFYKAPIDGKIECVNCGTTNDIADGKSNCSECGGYIGECSCGICDKFIGEGERYALTAKYHECDTEYTDLKNKYSYPTGILFCSEEHAFEGANQLYALAGASLKLPDILPTYKCANCGIHFEAYVLKKDGLMLTVERGPRYKPEILAKKYSAHFCLVCGRFGFWKSYDLAQQGLMVVR